MKSTQQYYLFILIAASAVGKSDLINKMKSEELWRTVPKYSTRDFRGTGDDVVSITSDDIRDAEHNGNQQEIRFARMQYIQAVCGDSKGVVYYKNNNFYGVSLQDILEGLKHSHLAVIISDFHVIRQLREINELKDKIKVLYLASTIDERELLKRYKRRETTDFNEESEKTLQTIGSIQKMCTILSSAARLKYLAKIEAVLPLLNEQWNNYVPYFDTIKTRSMNIRMLYNRYIDNIAYIDYPILNFYDLEFMYHQAKSIISKATPKRKISKPPVFMVCAAPSSGKKTLMEIVGDLGAVNKNILITKKYAKRNKRLTDGRDGMVAIGKNTSFAEHIPNPTDIWSWSFHNGATEYAVNRAEIDKNINNGIAQIFISNMTQIANAKQYYPDNIVILYLHATHETATKTHIEEKRKNEIIDTIIEESSKSGQSASSKEDALWKFDNDDKYQNLFYESVESDLEEIRDIHNSFLLHNTEIDHVLLNTGTREDLVEQMINLITYYSNNGE